MDWNQIFPLPTSNENIHPSLIDFFFWVWLIYNHLSIQPKWPINNIIYNAGEIKSSFCGTINIVRYIAKVLNQTFKLIFDLFAFSLFNESVNQQIQQ